MVLDLKAKAGSILCKILLIVHVRNTNVAPQVKRRSTLKGWAWEQAKAKKSGNIPKGTQAISLWPRMRLGSAMEVDLTQDLLPHIYIYHLIGAILMFIEPIQRKNMSVNESSNILVIVPNVPSCSKENHPN